ncbi:MAG TPA: tryptophanase [Candidatus Thermoplasmatota archaeon]|nr:tryptophanase [Candidatus Thermoplasmatota archaeon]
MAQREPPYSDRAEPWRVKVVEPIRRTTREARERLLKAAGYNLFALKAEDVFVDLLTDSGVGAMSADQWAGMMVGDESYAGARNFYSLQDSVRDVMGFGHVLPAHQGRGAEHVLCAALLKRGDIVPSNALFDTTRAHIEHVGATGVDLLLETAYDTKDELPFKGDIDLAALEALLGRAKPGQVPFAVMTVTCNMTGGQPVSMQNVREASKLLGAHGVPLIIDAARFAENSWFVKEREPGYEERTILEIARELFGYAAGCTMSAKKDGLVNIGGFLAFRDGEMYEKCLPFGILFEGYATYGGLAGRDLEAMARGLREGVDEAYLKSRTDQVRYLGERLQAAGVPVLVPVGGHAVYVDAGRFLPHVPWYEFPGHALACALYLESGVRAVEIGSLMAARDPETHENRQARMELMRLALPRRMYTDNHIDYVVQALAALYARREEVAGVELVREAPVLRHFTSSFRPVLRGKSAGGSASPVPS